MEYVNLKYVIGSLVYSFIGIAIYIVGFALLDILTPKVKIWKEIVENQNIALAILIGSVAIGIASIIASAIHG